MKKKDTIEISISDLHTICSALAHARRAPIPEGWQLSEWAMHKGAFFEVFKRLHAIRLREAGETLKAQKKAKGTPR